MDKKFAQTFVWLGAAVMLLSSSLVYAEGYGHDREQMQKRKGKMIEHLTEELGLTPEQVEQIKQQHSESEKQRQGIREALQAKKEELRQELEKSTVDKERVYAIIEEIKELEGQKLQQRVEGIMVMKEILTPEQFEKLKEKKKERGEKWGKHHKNMKCGTHEGPPREPEEF